MSCPVRAGSGHEKLDAYRLTVEPSRTRRPEATVILYAWHLPPLHEAAVEHDDAVHALEHLSFFGTVVLMWAAAIASRDRPVQPRLHEHEYDPSGQIAGVLSRDDTTATDENAMHGRRRM